jgi:hypothetical protein
MSKQHESQGMRDSAVDGPAATGSWDPYEVWLNRVKKPRDGVHSAPATTVVASATTTTTIKVAPDLSETQRLRTLSIPAS